MEFATDVFICALTYLPVIVAGHFLFIVMRFPDISIEVSWALGGIVALTTAKQYSLLPVVAFGVAPIVGAACGALTYFFFRNTARQKLLSSLIAYFVLLIIGSRILHGSAAIRLEQARFGFQNMMPALGFWLAICALLILLSYAWEKSRHGVRARMIGETNDEVSVIFGLRSQRYYLAMLALAGAAAAIGGAAFSLYNGGATNAQGIGVVLKAIFGALAGDRVCRLVGLTRRATILAVPVGALLLATVIVGAEQVALMLQTKKHFGFVLYDTDKQALIGIFVFLLLVWRVRSDPMTQRVSDL